MNLWESYYDAIKRQDWKKALKSLDSLKKSEPKNPQVHLKVGDVLRRTEDINGALKAYDRSADLLLHQGFTQKALAVYKIILSINPDNPEVIEKTKEIMGKMETPKPALLQPEKQPVPVPSPPPILEDRPSEVSVPEEKQLIKNLPALFSLLSQEDATDIIKRAETKSFHDAQAVVEEGDSGDSIFIVKYGNAKVITHIMGTEIELATLSEGDVFGEVGFLTGRLRTASVIAQGGLEVIELGRLLLEEIIEKSPEILRKIEDIYGSRVEDTLTRVKTLKGI